MAFGPEIRELISANNDYFIEALEHTKNRLMHIHNHEKIKENFPMILKETIEHYSEKKINFTIIKIKKNDQNEIYIELDGYEDVLKTALQLYLKDIKSSHEFVKQNVGFMPTTNQIENRIAVISKAIELL